MDITEILTDAYERVRDAARAAVEGCDTAALRWRPDAGANPIGWLVWHLTRVQDDHVAELAGREQVWVEGAWAPRFGLPADARDTGYGHTPEQVAALRPESAEVVLAYLDAVTDRTREHLATRTPAALDRIVDTRWDPPVTEGVRLVSVLEDGLQHAGQAAYVRGSLERTA